MCRHLRSDSGQASLEWLGIVALVGAMIVLGPAFAQADQLGRRVTREWVRAMCLVRQGDCRRDREPCVVSSTQRREGLSVDIAFVHLGDHHVARVERRSDGTYAVTMAAETAFGVQGHAGIGASVEVAGFKAAVGIGAVASATLAHEGGKTWIVRGDDALDGILTTLRQGVRVPRADVEYGTTDLESAAGVAVEADADRYAHIDVAGAQLAFDRRSGSRLDRRTGRRTIYVRSSYDGKAHAGDEVLGATGGGGEIYAVELDATGRPVDLQVVTTGVFDGTPDLPAVVAPVRARLDFPAEAGAQRTYEVTAHLDLTDPGNLAAAADLLQAISQRGPRIGSVPQATQALRRRIDERGTVEARVLSTSTTSHTVGLDAFLGGKFGAEVSRSAASTRLVAAVSRGLDGQWLVRGECADPA